MYFLRVLCVFGCLPVPWASTPSEQASLNPETTKATMGAAHKDHKGNDRFVVHPPEVLHKIIYIVLYFRAYSLFEDL